jgi:hypothetical protein
MNTHVTDRVLKQRPSFVLLLLLSFALIIDFPVVDIPNLSLVRNAEAIVGRPASPTASQVFTAVRDAEHAIGLRQEPGFTVCLPFARR